MSVTLDCIDKRIRKLIKLCIKRNNRSLFTILGRQGWAQVPRFYDLLQQCKVQNISPLWCAKKTNIARSQYQENLEKYEECGQSFHTVSEPYFCSYSEVEKIAHRTFNVVVLQDFNALTLQCLSTVIGTVKGGGIIIFLLNKIKNLSDLETLELDVQHKPSRFCKRFGLSLSSCVGSMILDQSLQILSCGPKFLDNLEAEISSQKEKIEELKSKHENDPVISGLLGVCRTGDQAELLMNFLDVLQKRTFHAVSSVSSPVRRGKSAALGLAIAGALAFNYSNIFLSSVSHSHVNTVFKFVLKGLDLLGYKEDEDFDLIESINPKFNNALTGINVFRDHPQSVRFILPEDIGHRLDQAELVVFDEVAAIPIHTLKQLFGSYIVLMASSTSGPGASSPYLYSKMITDIQPSSTPSTDVDRFQKFTIDEPIHYSHGDGIEAWFNRLLCVQPTICSHLSCGFPVPEQCQLFCVSRDALLRSSNQAEDFMQSLMSILTSSSREMVPDHLLELTDSPNYRIFCLLPPTTGSTKASSTIICAVLVHLETEIPENIGHCAINIKNPMSQCFNEWKSMTTTSQPNFLPLQGVHVLNIVTHQSYRKMGYGLRAFQLLQEFYEGKCINLDENLELSGKVNKTLNVKKDSNIESPILQQLTEIQPEHVEYILVSCNLQSQPLRFWKKAGFIPINISEKNNFTKDHIIFMIKSISEKFEERIAKYWCSFQNYYFVHLGSDYQNFSASLALTLMHFNPCNTQSDDKELTKADIDLLIKPHQMKSLENYCRNLQDFHAVLQFIPTLAILFFKKRLKNIILPRAQEAILLSFGLQFKTSDDISKDLGLPNMQINGLLNRTVKKLVKYLTDIIEKSVSKSLDQKEVVMEPIAQSLYEELEDAAKEATDAMRLKELDVSQYAIKGSEDDWHRALITGRSTLVSIKSMKKLSQKLDKAEAQQNFKKSETQQGFKKNKFQNKKKR